MKREYFRQIFKNLHMKFHENMPIAGRQKDQQTDRHDRSDSCFS